MKNYFMELIQKAGEIPEKGENYQEIVTQISGGDHNPIFEAEVFFEDESAIATATTKKEALRMAWKDLYEGY